VVTERSAWVMIQMRPPQFVCRKHARAVAHAAQVLQLVVSSKRSRVQVHMADDVVDWVLAGGRESVQSPGVAMSRPSRKRGVPTGAGPGRAEHDQGVSAFAYDADGPEVLGLGPA